MILVDFLPFASVVFLDINKARLDIMPVEGNYGSFICFVLAHFAFALKIIVVVEADTSVLEHEKVLHCVLSVGRRELTFFYFLLISEVDDLVEESALWVADLVTLDARHIVTGELLDNMGDKLLVLLLRVEVFRVSEVL